MKLKLLFAMLLGGALSAAAQGGYQDGVDNYNAGRLDVAKIILENTINDPQTNKSVSYYYLGAIDFQGNDLNAAKANFDKGVAADPANGMNYIGLGEVALKQGQKGAAEDFFKQGMQTDKKNTALMAAVARAYYNVDPVAYDKEINKYLDKALKDSKNTESAVFMLQGDMKAMDDPGNAASLYELAIEADKNKNIVNREAYVKYANTYFRVAPKFAIQKLEELNQLEPNSALAQRELAEKYYDNSQFGSACLQYGKYLENPNHFQKDEQRYAGLLYSAKDYDKSLEVANSVLSKDPTNFYMYRVIMMDYAAKEDWPAAEAAGAKLFGHPDAEYIPNDYILYGDALAEQGKYEEAVKTFGKAIELNPDKPELLPKLSLVHDRAGNSEKAVEVMKQYLDAGNGSLNDIINMGRRYASLARKLEKGTPERVAAADEGIKYYDKALERVSDNAVLYRLKGEILLARNDDNPNAEIAALYEKMLELLNADPANRESQVASYRAADYVLGIYYSDVDKAKAKQYLEDYLKIDPENEGIKKLYETLGN
ncbi:tetratricopeptide repeat protein [Paramuribaculum intestinale]|uniref:tetratricopeptide repeat protein n=2 Tax=Paramuribaculum intestinale TaxID=2094151 RepID=UPI000FFF1341|nr:tetratricopeptide repeat protein [Paramuribaculum intestinale]RXE63019.1 tetratricopeptide repeat protein [Muribaculaceae bacterium Isolate-004 (NCI)]